MEDHHIKAPKKKGEKKFITYQPMRMEQTECSETSAYKIQTPGNHPKRKNTTYRTQRKFEIKKKKKIAIFAATDV
jgi:hypothetical protein